MAERKKGYHIELDKDRNILKLRLWGLWNSALAQQFTQEVKPKIEEMSRHAPQGWYSLVDLSRFPAQHEDIQAMTQDIMRFEIAHGIKKGATLMARTLTKMQIARLARQAGFDPGSFFQSEDEAIRWLLQS